MPAHDWMPDAHLVADCAMHFRGTSSDIKQDGRCRILGGEARDFFTRTGLPFGELSKVWRAVKQAVPATGEGLTRAQFGAALRLAAVAQVCRGDCCLVMAWSSFNL